MVEDNSEAVLVVSERFLHAVDRACHKSFKMFCVWSLAKWTTRLRNPGETYRNHRQEPPFEKL
jgi:hypothetical protein